ncbi:N-acetylglucosamine kinase [uncultured Tenacibaculum sp.]|uniref:N-acetylglucosamine kinase n=1 Tax=uncultured Tenacibaculum sp. TaxID=174713 RepID=UPI0026200684|nr:N-acetylglucosamine kinase [uncultured Tenacibaculum sp.]
MILVADSGSTKCDWVLIGKNKKKIKRVRTKGLNPAILKEEDLVKIIEKNETLRKYKTSIEQVYFFGAGCNTEKSKSSISKVLLSQFTNTTKFYVNEDLMLAALSITSKPAVVCILGTGSNCCFFNGEEVLQKNLAMGYLLMDEGSGNHLGKELLKKYFYNKMPQDLQFSFEKEFKLNPQKVISKLYTSKAPNKYLAKHARFLFENIEHPFCQEIINKSINEFVENQLKEYREELASYPVYFIGSVAYFSQNLINEKLQDKNIKPSKRFVRRPLQSFIQRIKNGEEVFKNIKTKELNYH